MSRLHHSRNRRKTARLRELAAVLIIRKKRKSLIIRNKKSKMTRSTVSKT